ncbi:MAG: AAA family ATPase, partial [Planctomycetes bacterium]|nr:AAA family ATPase [Planctomycetota bacterium]
MSDVLLQVGRAGEALEVLREALQLAPNDSDIKLSLARTYRLNGKTSAAMVILEEMIRLDEASAAARVERARGLFAEGAVEDAVREYRRALDEDPDAADQEFGERLGITSSDADDLDDLDRPIDGRQRISDAGADDAVDIAPTRSDIDFGDVGGMADLKRDIQRKIIQPLKHPELYAAYGKKIGGGILLYGPPGCGKTHIARATAGEIDANFLSIGIHEVLDMWVGRSERN